MGRPIVPPFFLFINTYGYTLKGRSTRMEQQKQFEMAKVYAPREMEDRIYEMWEKSGAFNVEEGGR